MPFLRTRGYSALPVHFLGQSGDREPALRLPAAAARATATGRVARLADVFGWAFAIWGTGLYWWAGFLYAYQVDQLMRSPRVVSDEAT